MLLDPQASMARTEVRIVQLGQALLSELPHLFPSQIGLNTPSPTRDPAPPLPEKYSRTVAALPAPTSGYLREIDGDQLIALARRYDLVIHLSQRPGRFLLKDAPLAHAHPASRVTHQARQQLQNAFHMSPERLKPQDAETVIQQLVQIACRSLSAALNDSWSAMACIDWLGAGLRALTGQALPSPFRTDSKGVLCVIAPSTGFSELAELSFAEIRHFSPASPRVTIHLFDQAAELARFARRAEDRQWLGRHVQAVQEASRHYPLTGAELDRIDRAWRKASHAIGIDASDLPPEER